MLTLILGLVVFFGVHCVHLYAGPWRDRQLAANEGRWKGAYSLVSLLGLILIVWGWAQYRPAAPQVYLPPAWGHHVTMLFVLVGLILIVAAYVPVGRIKASVRNPFLIGIILWSLGHLLANGDMAGLLLFGCFLVYAVVDLIAVTARHEAAPVFAGYRGDAIAVAVGLVVYLALLLKLHEMVLGVSPLA